MQYLQLLLNLLNHTSTLTQTQLTLEGVECIYSRAPNCIYLKIIQNLLSIYFVKLLINNNLAQYGGGIFVADDTQRSACGGGATENDATQITISADCFIQTIRLYPNNFLIANPNYLNTFMTNNTATQSGADIYGGLLDRCTITQNAEYHNGSGLDYVNNTIKSSTELSISSKPVFR